MPAQESFKVEADNSVECEEDHSQHNHDHPAESGHKH